MEELKEALINNFGYGYTGKGIEIMTGEVVKNLIKNGVDVTESVIKTVISELSEGSHISPEKRARYREIKRLIDEECPKYGNDIKEVDMFARDVANTYTKEVEKYKNYRGGIFQAGLYPVSANVPLGAQTGATPDGRLAFTPIADGIGPASGRDV